MRAGKVFGAILMIVGLLVTVFASYQLAFVPATPATAAIVVTWAADTTCGFGGIAAVDCWASNESLSLDAAALTVTVKLDIIKQTAGDGAAWLNPDDIAFTFSVGNSGPPVYDVFGNEVPQPVYVQVTSISTITADTGIAISIVDVDTIQRLEVGMRDFSDTNWKIQQTQGLLGTLLAGASDTAKLDIQFRTAAFDATPVAAGMTWHIRGTVGNQAFDISVYASQVA